MARILLGWELGANTGHIHKLTDTGLALEALGHRPIYAAHYVKGWPAGAEVWQAPLWPQQLATLARPVTQMPATMGDILAQVGLTDSEALEAQLRAWDSILRAVQPAAIGIDYAPALSLAALGRIPVVSLGTGFTQPPSHLPRFPGFTGRPPLHDEGRLLEGVNHALARIGRPRRGALPEIFAADRELASVFRELDPYREWRTGENGTPTCKVAPEQDGAGDELFVYINGTRPRPASFWQGLVQSGLPIRIHNPHLTVAETAALEKAGVAVEPRPVPFDRIVRRSRMLLSHGGLGFATSALIAGLPHIIAPYDIEKGMIAAAVTELGLGRTLHSDDLTAQETAALLRSAWGDDDLRARTRAAAPGFRNRIGAGAGPEAAAILAAFAG